MATVSVTLPADGTTADVSDYNTPITTLVTAINGNLDSTNIASLSGTKLTAGTVPGSAFDTTTAGGWNALSGTYTYAGNNGNKEFTVTTPSDVTGSLSAGMKVRFTRGTTAPTQAMSFTAASSQYATKASPTGITFTSAFTCEAWVYLNSYVNGGVVGRSDNSTGGFFLVTNGSGQLVCDFGSGSAFTGATSYQSVPLKRWVHVAGVCTSVASKTFALYINGVLVPSFVSGSATSLTQTGNLSVGAIGAGAAGTFFDGYMSEPRIWSVAQTQANIQANMAISLTGAESGLVFLAQGNGNANDKTSNANNLTLTNGAIATQLANPYNNTEYGIITKVTSTQLTVFTGTDYTIPNMTLNSPQYSLQRTPYGFPASRNKWVVDTQYHEDRTFGVLTANVYYNSFPGLSLSIPTGEWVVRLQVQLEFQGTTSATMIGKTGLTTEAVASNAGISNLNLLLPEFSSRYGAMTGTALDANVCNTSSITNTAATTYTAVFNSESAAGSFNQRHIGQSINETSYLRAECAYL